jgi:hypothetical protein
MAMRSKTEVLEETIEKAIDNFSDNYVDKVVGEGRLNFTAEDIKTAYVEGAKWMSIFLEIKDVLWPTL